MYNLLTPNIRNVKVREFIRFVIVGAIVTGIQYVVYLLVVKAKGIVGGETLYTNIAYTISYIVAWICNFFFSAYYTFKSNTSVKRGIGFALSRGVNYIFQLAFLNLFLWVGVSETWAPLPVFCICGPINFVMVRYVFHSKHLK